MSSMAHNKTDKIFGSVSFEGVAGTLVCNGDGTDDSCWTSCDVADMEVSHYGGMATLNSCYHEVSMLVLEVSSVVSDGSCDNSLIDSSSEETC